MIAAGGGIAVSHPLPAEGIDLRAELAAHQRERVEQALARAGGDLSLAASLLRVTPLELARLHSGDDALAPAPAAVTRAERRREREAKATRLPDDLPRVSGGVELISTAVIRRLAAEGRSARSIANYLGCNHFTVEKVLRIEAEREARRLHGEGMRPLQIALRLGVSRTFVAKALEPQLAKCGPERPPAPSASPASSPEPRDRWRGA